MPDIPLIAVDDLESPDPARRQAVADALGEASRGTGFFYARHASFDDALLKRAFARSKELFDLPMDQKDNFSIKHSPHNRGYVALGGERLQEGAPPDQKEAFNIGLDLPADHPEVRAGVPFRGVNLWPDLPGWRADVLAYYNACWSLGRLIHHGLARDLGLDEAFFEDKLDAPLATLRLLHYPARPVGAAADKPGAGEHTDYGNITILATDGIAGLEVRNRQGGWIDAPHIPGALICNIGDCLMRWTNDVYVSTPHRVRVPDHERYSIAFFLDPNPDATVAVIPACVPAGEHPHYPPTTGAAYLRARLDATYDHLREASAAGC